MTFLELLQLANNNFQLGMETKGVMIIGIELKSYAFKRISVTYKRIHRPMYTTVYELQSDNLTFKAI